MNESAIGVGLKELQPTALRFAAQAAVDRQTHLLVVHSLDVRVAGDFVSMPHCPCVVVPDEWKGR